MINSEHDFLIFINSKPDSAAVIWRHRHTGAAIAAIGVDPVDVQAISDGLSCLKQWHPSLSGRADLTSINQLRQRQGLDYLAVDALPKPSFACAPAREQYRIPDSEERFYHF